MAVKQYYLHQNLIKQNLHAADPIIETCLLKLFHSEMWKVAFLKI